jgi:thymidylate kinase
VYSTSQPEIATQPLAGSAPLVVVAGMFGRLRAEGIGYCHWKSNEHLGPATRGETDLDVLVNRSDSLRVSHILAETGYKRFSAPAESAHAGIEDYLGLDEETGKLVHLHLHYRLILGEKFLKGYRVPWERVLLSGRVLDPLTGLHTSAPEAELLLLAVRAALKLRSRDRLGAGHRSPARGDDVLREFRWLADRVDPERLRALAVELLGPAGEPPMMEILETGLTWRGLLRLQRAIEPVMRPYRAFSPAEARALRWKHEWLVRWNRLRQRVCSTRRALRLGSPRGGLVIAFLGADGSGKSTLTKAVGSWLGWKLEVLPLYFGYGDGPVSLVRRPLRLLQNWYARGLLAKPVEGGGVPAGTSASSSVPGWRSAPKAVWRMLYAWSIVSEKRSRIRQAQRARHLGWIVIADRYPQAQIKALSDGPLLESWAGHRWPALRIIARWEEEAYRSMEAVAPDLVIKLHVSPAVSVGRKSDATTESLGRRADTVRRIRFPESTRVLDIDADQPLDTVVSRVKRGVWEAL